MGSSQGTGQAAQHLEKNVLSVPNGNALAAAAMAPVIAVVLNAPAAGPVADEQQVQSMVESVQSAFGHIDILIDNVGIFTQSLVENLSIADWDKVLGVNLRGTFLCTRLVLPYNKMLNLRFAIISISFRLQGGTE